MSSTIGPEAASQGLEAIVGQERAVARLKSALAIGKMHHAYLFEGPDGVGKRTTALALARAWNCERRPGHGCGECGPCRKILAGVHPDVVSFAVLDEEGKVKGQTDRMRELIGAIGYPPHEGRARVVIVDPADELIPQAANAFLKTLEEPPPANHFVLLAAAAARLPITIRSRCQRVPFSPLPATLVARLLVEAHEVDPAAAESAAALAGGSLSRALQLASSEELPARRERVGRLLKAARSGRATSALEAAAEVSGEREEALATLELLWVALHDGLARGAGVAAALPAHPDSERLGAAVPTAALLRAIEAVQEASDAVRGYVSPQLAVERMLLRMQQSGAG